MNDLSGDYEKPDCNCLMRTGVKDEYALGEHPNGTPKLFKRGVIQCVNCGKQSRTKWEEAKYEEMP